MPYHEILQEERGERVRQTNGVHSWPSDGSEVCSKLHEGLVSLRREHDESLERTTLPIKGYSAVKQMRTKQQVAPKAKQRGGTVYFGAWIYH